MLRLELADRRLEVGLDLGGHFLLALERVAELRLPLAHERQERRLPLRDLLDGHVVEVAFRCRRRCS